MHALKNDVKNIDRLQKRSDFLRVNQNGRKWVAGSMIVQVAGNDREKPRFGLTVSKKVSKKAVTRNRIKRRLRAVCYDVLPQIAHTENDYVVIGRTTTEKVPYETLLKDLKWCLKRLECLK